ncbi:MAG TPA: hypothetical protein VH044_02590 [Polyangiaceae bacterium]|nr:hypothetical protein [Polyangiaceae bacterium]
MTTKRELMILDTSVVDDPLRSPSSPVSGGGDGGAGGVGGDDGGEVFEDGGEVFVDGGVSPAEDGSVFLPPPPIKFAADSPSAGVWTFGQLARDLAATPADAPAMIEQLFDTWLADQNVNGFTVAARSQMQQTLLNIWPRAPTGELDLDQAPMRLQAIVNRVDLRNLAAGSAGEGRFVFGVNAAGGFPQDFTVIFEFNLPAQTVQDALDWANAWHALASHPFPSEEYNAALEALTRRFAGHNAQPSGVNGSALAALRTNENVLSPSGEWELREFILSAATGRLQETTVKETPNLGFNNSQPLTAQ